MRLGRGFWHIALELNVCAWDSSWWRLFDRWDSAGGFVSRSGGDDDGDDDDRVMEIVCDELASTAAGWVDCCLGRAE